MPLYALDGVAPALPAGFCWIADSAVLIGNVTVGEDVGIWFGSVLRGDNERITIGTRSNIQENSVLHTDLGFPLAIGEGCTIGHRAMVHGCTIGDNSLIGMGAIVLNGAVIGRNCLIGAGALVTEGMTIPDNSLALGAPARVVRQIDAAGVERLAKSAAHYVDNARRFAAGLRVVSK
jgi:carbonic anhydrase/acetyltransferase-like protein (isoleucine patch superfamily)